MARAVVVIHGGYFNNNLYAGGTKDYIPLADGGISFPDFLRKLEVRLNKESKKYTFDVVALVEGDQGENMRMKVTDQFEWSCLLDMMEVPTVYVNACPHASVATLNAPCHKTNLDIRVANQWIIPGASEQASLRLPEPATNSEPMCHIGELGVGSVFSSNDSMVSSIHSYHLKKFLEFRTKVSDAFYYYLQCKFELTCVFCLRSLSFGCAWRVYEFVAHTCQLDIRTDIEPRVSSRAIADFVGPHMSEDGFILRPRDIQGQFLREFGVRLKYPSALARRNRAMNEIYGAHDKSFQMIAKYLYMLEHMNPGSLVDLQTAGDNSFQYCYFSLTASIRAFRACRPIVVIDATHLKGKYKGVLFVASTKDSNEQIVPLAFCLGDKENDSSWTWFLDHVRMSFGCPPNLLIVSDQHKSIKNAVEAVFPGTPHGFCTYHIQGNLRPFAEGILDIFHAAANAYKEGDFEKHMRNLEECAPGVYAKLIDIGPARWARCKCPVRRYAFGTSNAVEVLNSRLLWASQLPVTSLLEYCRNLVQSWFYQRRTQARDRTNEVSEYAEERLAYAIGKWSYMTVQPVFDAIFNILSGQKSYLVDIVKRECSCKVFDSLLLPCSHAAAAIRFKNQNPIAYVDDCYLTTTWREVYANDVMPVPDPSVWYTPTDVECWIVGTPKNPKQAGRPKASRVPSGCVIRVAPSKEGIQTTKTISKRRKPKECRICGVRGHTRATCKDPRRFE